MGQKKSGTISKVMSHHFSKKELEDIENQIDRLAREAKEPVERYTRHVSDIIKAIRDKVEILIMGGGKPGLTQKDTASYVWKVFQDYNIPYGKSNFYKYFSPEQKREWQTEEFFSKKKNPNHEHIFDFVEDSENLGEIRRCGGIGEFICGALMINGKIHEAIPDEPQEPELKVAEPKPTLAKKFWKIIEAFQEAGNNMYDFAGALKKDITLLTDEEFEKLRGDIFLMQKAGEFVKMAIDKKHIIHPFTMHRLVLAYGEETQNYAGGLFLMSRLDLATRKHGKGVKTFKDISEFSKMLSSKQTAKAMGGKVREIDERYEPRIELDAQDMGFSGQQCTSCGNLRVGYDRVPNPNWKEGDPAHEKTNVQLICYHCLAVQTRKLFSLPKTKPIVYVDIAS